MGQVHQKVGLDVGEDRTLQEPPFWQRGPGPVWQGFMYWQYSPTCIAVQLQPDIQQGAECCYYCTECNLVTRVSARWSAIVTGVLVNASHRRHVCICCLTHNLPLPLL